MITTYPDADSAWQAVLHCILEGGSVLSPRGQVTKEVLHSSLAINMRFPAVLNSHRKLSYSFMAAEALWILRGSDRCEDVAPYNKNIAQFSDNGVSFQGAYGPMVSGQLDYVVNCLLTDQFTRQAVIAIWRPNPRPSKDIPCTVSLTFNIRDNELNCHAFMRSSDAWLGWPYDVFNFTAIAMLVAARLYKITGASLNLGRLFWTGVSSHLYQQHFELSQSCLTTEERKCSPLPQHLWHDEALLLETLRLIRDKQDALAVWSPRHAS